MRIGVCIPCHKPYIQYISKCLESIENQERKPDVVSISFSEVDNPPVLQMYTFPIEITTTSEKQCQSKNRNIAASKIDVDVLTFFDADDLMHPNRLASIENAFNQGLDGFLHNHKQCKTSQYRTRPLSNIFWEQTDNILYTDGFSSTRDSICGRIESIYGGLTNGHFSCKQSIWKSIPFLEGHGLGEDCEYVYQIYSQGYKLGYTSDKLSYYIRDDFPEDPNLHILDSYSKYDSIHRPPVYTNYNNTETKNVIDFLLSDKSPERIYPIFIISHVHEFPENTIKKILYNIEQMTRDVMLERNVSRMRGPDIVEIWDYSISNYNILKNYNFSVRHIPFKLNINRIIDYRNLQTIIKEYDIAFCGQVGPYREKILNELKARGKNVLIIDGNYTLTRDIEIGKSKLLINIHFNETYKVFESIRCEPWLSSGFTVLTETSLDDDSRAITVPYDTLVDKACEILDSMRQDIINSNNNSVVFYCNNLEMRNPKHYYSYEKDRDMYIYNMALEFRNKNYNVTIYAHTVFNNYDGIVFKNPKLFEPTSEIYILILFPSFTQSLISSLINTYSIFICMDTHFNIRDYNLEKVSKLFFESSYIRNKYAYIEDNKVSILYESLQPIVESVERSRYKILCTQPYTHELISLLYGFWPYIKKNIPQAELNIVSDPSILSSEHREFIKTIIEQPGINELGLISDDRLQYEKKTSLIHLNLSSIPENIASIDESIELGCIPILSDIYKKKVGIHISEVSGSQKCIEKIISIYISLINSSTNIIDEYRTLLKTKTNTYTSETLLEKVESYLNSLPSLHSKK